MKYEFNLQKVVLSVIWFRSATIGRQDEYTARVKRTIFYIISIIP